MALGLSSCIGVAVKTVVKKTGLQYTVPSPKLYAVNGDFGGLRDLIAQPDTLTVNIMLTHGLTDKKIDHFDLFTERLASQLSLKLENGRTTIDSGMLTNNVDGRMLGFERWKLFRWKFKSEAARKTVNFYFVYWAPITKPAKDFIHAYNESIHRTRLSSLTKDSLFINIFGDLALYLNVNYKVALRKAFLDSFEHIYGPFVVIGGGFGVQVLFDAVTVKLSERARTDTSYMQRTIRGANIQQMVRLEKAQEPAKVYKSKYDITRAYLLTNQMPFVSLLTLEPNDPADRQAHNDKIYAVISEYCRLKKRSIDLISFYDPNDPFGYMLPPVTDSLIQLRNVSLNIADYWRINPIKTTEFVLPQLKSQKASDVFLSVIDQQHSTQDLMLNLKGPSDLTRNDNRVLGALADGSKYKFVCLQPTTLAAEPRDLEVRKRENLAAFKASVAEEIADRLKKKLEIKVSVLPFSLPSQYRDTNPDTIMSLSFDGIDRSINRNDVTQIMTVHGVKDQVPDSFDDIANSCAKSLGFYGRPSEIRFKCPANETCPKTGELNQSYRPGTVKITTFEGVFGQKLIVYAVYWSSITKPAKVWLDSISIQDESSVAPRMVKQHLINDGFADIELSFGLLKDQVDETLKTALVAMDEDYNRLNATGVLNTYFLTGSLGTRLLLDFLNENKNRQVDYVRARTRTWFMLTNQLIMTALRDIRLNNDKTGDFDNAIGYEDFFNTAYGDMRHILDDSTAFDVVAFNDPNDLLSFIVPDDEMGISTHERKIYNTYLNLAQGVNVNMDALIRTVVKVDNKLAHYHRREYRRKIRCFKRCERRTCAGSVIAKSDPEYRDYIDMLKSSRDRFSLRRWRRHRFAPASAENINPMIEKCLRNGEFETKRLRRFFDRKKKWYAYNLYVTEKEWNRLEGEYEDLRKSLNSRCEKKVIRRVSFNRLFRPGLVMPFIRSVADYKHYQSFVTDFGRAHVGAKESSKVVQMITHGFDAVTKTNVDQHLYEKIHNSRQTRTPPKKP